MFWGLAKKEAFVSGYKVIAHLWHDNNEQKTPKEWVLLKVEDANLLPARLRFAGEAPNNGSYIIGWGKSPTARVGQPPVNADPEKLPTYKLMDISYRDASKRFQEKLNNGYRPVSQRQGSSSVSADEKSTSQTRPKRKKTKQPERNYRPDPDFVFF